MKTFIVVLLIAIATFSIGGLLGHLHSVMSESSITPTSMPMPTKTFSHLDSMKIYNLINDYRVSQGLNKLLFDPSMCAYTKTRLEQTHTDWSHNGFNQTRPEYFIHPNVSIGENLAKGNASEYSEKYAVESWIASPGHLKNIVDSRFTRTCISTDNYNNQNYVVQEFSSY